MGSKTKQLAIALTVVGAILWIVGFALNGSSSNEADHGHSSHATEHHADASHDDHADAGHDDHADAGHDDHADASHDDHGHAGNDDYPGEAHAAMIESALEHDAHAAHEAHQIANRPWSALYVAAIFFLGLGLGQLFFLGIQYVAQAGWSAGLLRVMEAQAFAIVIPLIVILIISFLGFGHVHHMFHWMVEGIDVQGHPNYDAIIAEKTGFLSPLFFSIRAIVYTVGWIWAAKMLRKNSLLSDSGDGVAMWKKNRGVAAAFTVFYAVTSSTSACLLKCLNSG